MQLYGRVLLLTSVDPVLRCQMYADYSAIWGQVTKLHVAPTTHATVLLMQSQASMKMVLG